MQVYHVVATGPHTFGKKAFAPSVHHDLSSVHMESASCQQPEALLIRRTNKKTHIC